MLLKIGRLVGVGIAGVAMANAAHAAESATVTTGAASTRLGGEFRSEMIYDDHGLEKRSGFTPDKTTELQVTNANVKLDGNYNQDTEYSFRFNLLNPANGPLDYGYGTHWFSKMIGFSAGKERVMQGGWDHMDSSYRTHVEGVFADNLAFDDYDTMLALHLNVAGRINLQIVNDVTTGGAANHTGEWSKTEHPTWVLGWMGDFGPIKPLVDFGSYDNNKSRWVDVGVKTEMNGLDATLDFWQKNVVHKVPKASDPSKNEEKADTATAITLNVSYEVKNVVTPWIYFSTFDNKQADTDRKYNTMHVDATTGAQMAEFDDNGVTWGVGANLDTMGKGWNPFLALVGQSGKFQKDPTSATSSEETRSNLMVKLGVLGEI